MQNLAKVLFILLLSVLPLKDALALDCYLGGSGGGYGCAKSFSEETSRAVDAEVFRIIGECHEEGKRLLNAHRKELDALAEALVERETLDEQEILAVTGLPPAPPLETGKLPVPGTDGASEA